MIFLQSLAELSVEGQGSLFLYWYAASNIDFYAKELDIQTKMNGERSKAGLKKLVY